MLDEAETGFRAVDDALGLCEVTDARALLAMAEGNEEAGHRLFVEAEAARERIGAPLPPAYRQEYERARRSRGYDGSS